ncbi:MAG: plastocyanin/azurin family copper-binding protein [Acidimicrobiia bacterium]
MRRKLWTVAATLALAIPTAGAGWAEAAEGGPQQSAGPLQAVAIVEPDGWSDPSTWTYDPPDVTVPAGSTVRWTNEGVEVHDAVADDGSFRSPILQAGESWEHTFTEPGEFPYYCKPHPYMRAVLKVT